MKPNTEQLAVINSESRNLAVIAGPGSGKTHTVACRIRRLLNDGVHPLSIAAVTYTNAAADTLAERLPEIGFVGTLHGMLFQILQSYGRYIGLNGPLTIIDEDTAKEILDETVKELKYSGTKRDVQKALEDKQMSFELPTRAQLVGMYYRSYLKRRGLLDYDSILRYGLECVRSLPVSKLSFGDVQIWYLFVDEFQDVSDLDYEVYHALPIEFKCFVGDPDQAIFGFRGGNFKNLVSFASTATTLKLQANFRCWHPITYAADLLISFNTDRIDKSTLPVSNNTAEVVSREFESPGEERRHVLKLLECEPYEPKSTMTAIILRTNRLVNQWTDFIGSAGIHVEQEKQVERPREWPILRLLVSVMLHPDNDWLFKKWFAFKNSQEEADALYLRSCEQFVSMNSLTAQYSRPDTIAEFMQFAAEEGSLSSETLFYVNSIADSLPQDATLFDLARAMDTDDYRRDRAPGVAIITYHAAKGREFDRVFLPAFEEGIIPNASKNADLEEERRLAYVGITRAVRFVCITHCKQRDGFDGQMKDSTASRFLKEMSP